MNLWRVVVYAALLGRCVQAVSLVTVKNVTIVGTQLNSPRTVSRDGGVSVLLNGKVLWLFDDTLITDTFGELISFSSNSAAVALDARNVTSLQDIIRPVLGASGSQVRLQDEASSQTGGWIPLSSSELAFNQKQTSGSRLAICESIFRYPVLERILTQPGPGTNPLAVSPAVAFLWAPVVQVSNTTNKNTKTAQQDYTYLYTTVCKIQNTKSGVVVSRLVESVFAAHKYARSSEQFAPFGCFASIVGRTSKCYERGSSKCLQRSYYLLAASGDGLQLARIPLQDTSRSETAYEFWQSDSCNFSTPGDTSELSASTSSYLQGSFSSGSVFYSPFFRTFLMIYMNADADSTLYLRYLDLDLLSCASNGTIWQRGGINGQGIAMEDAEAITHYQWSKPQLLLKTPIPTDSALGYNYAGIAHPEYFNRQYYQLWMYLNGGIESTMRSPWLGHEVVSEAAAGGDGRQLMLSWTMSGKTEYQIVMAKLEFDGPQESSATAQMFSHRWKALLGLIWVLVVL